MSFNVICENILAKISEFTVYTETKTCTIFFRFRRPNIATMPGFYQASNYTWGEFNNAIAQKRSLFWYLSLFVMCKAWYQYNERSSAHIVELASAHSQPCALYISCNHGCKAWQQKPLFWKYNAKDYRLLWDKAQSDKKGSDMEQYLEVCRITRSVPNYTYIFIDFVHRIGSYVKVLAKTKPCKLVSFRFRFGV